jgi:hypothetical protein
MIEDPNIKNRKKPTDHRQGKLIRLVDAIQRLTAIPHEDDYWIYNKDDIEDSGHINPKYADEMDDILRELNVFDIYTFGNLYLTAGERVVLDKGCVEYFNETDTVLFTLKEITSGIPYDRFMEKMKSIKK